jgi:radical SAM protein with 4Fe4S-binding SPASM domain
VNPKKKFWLFKQSQHFCAVPWNHFEVWSNGDIRTCSKGLAFGNINETSIEDILNSNEIKSIKNDLLADKLNKNCHGCHKLTTPGEHYDLRNHYNPMFKSFDIDYENTQAFELHGIDLHWNNTCNFKCVYCNPLQSSLIAEEQKIPVSRSSTQNINKIIEMIVKNQYVMKEIYFSGGEPLLIKHNATLLAQIENKELPLRVNSNISVANDNNPVFDEIKKFKNVLWTVSAESTNERFNYIRNGGDWNSFINNLENIKKLGHKIRLNSVFFIGSLATIFDNIEYFIVNHNVTDITINQLSGHSYLRPRNAGSELKEKTLARLEKLLASGLVTPQSNSYYNILRCQRELQLPVDNDTGYIKYFDQLDQLRNTNWRKVFSKVEQYFV